ncbi:MAG: ATP synthase F1 subunit delta [Ruminococcaceae bacterium]|nr:ATP synthase F1 subunit delta [Oscillospiraceae bacterium]
MSDISNEYAKALFMLATEKECRDDYKLALETVADIFGENPTYTEFLSTFAIPLDQRLDALEAAFSDAVPRDVLSFLKLLCEKKHISEFPECVAHYVAMYNELDKISNAKVTSAVELTDGEKAALKEKLEKTSGHTMVIDYTVDQSIIGGLIIETDGKIMDSSLKKHLKAVKDVISR